MLVPSLSLLRRHFNAKSAVEEGLSLKKAAKLYKVPNTMHDPVLGKTKFGAKSGLEGYLIAVEEAELLNYLLRCSDIGYDHFGKQILSIVQSFVDGKGIDTIVTNGWWERFCQQHPEVTLRTPVPLSAIASGCESVNNYFDLLEETLLENKNFNKPSNIFNLDESGFPLNPRQFKVL